MPPRRGPTVLLGVRIGVLLAAAAAVGGAFVLAHRRAGSAARLEPAYACPMHPGVGAVVAGPCPICGMALVARHAWAAASAPAGAVPDAWTLPDGLVVPEAAIGRSSRMGVAQEVVAPAWMEPTEGGAGLEIVALFYDDESFALTPAARATFQAAACPGRPRPPAVRVARAAGPARRWDETTSRVRWRVIDGTRLTGDETGWIELPARDREVEVLPYQAIVPSPAGAHVFAVSADRRTLTRRSLATGQIVFDFVTVVAGVPPGERLLVEGASLYEAERRLALPPVQAPP